MMEISDEATYKLYPRKGSKAQGLRSIRRAVFRISKANGIPFHSAQKWLMCRVMDYAKSVQGKQGPDPKTGKDYRPLAKTFFGNERYLDNPEDWGVPKPPPRDRAEVALEKRIAEQTGYQAELAREIADFESIPTEEIPGMIEVVRSNAHPTMAGCYENGNLPENRWLLAAVLEIWNERRGQTG